VRSLRSRGEALKLAATRTDKSQMQVLRFTYRGGRVGCVVSLFCGIY
jgi:hypothetical protein